MSVPRGFVVREARVRFSIAALLIAAVSSRAHAATCNPSICVGSNPCTIAGTQILTEGCNLDLHSSAVKITGTVKSEFEGGSFSIRAASLDLRGTLQAKAGSIFLDVGGSATMQTGWAIDVSKGGEFGIEAGGPVSTVGGRIDADGIGGDDAGTIWFYAASVSTSGTILTADASIGGSGGEIAFVSEGDVTVGGTTSAKGSGLYAPGGSITVEAGPSGKVVIDAGVTATGDQDGVDGEIFIDPACSVVVTGGAALKTRNLQADGYGYVAISSRSNLTIAPTSQLRGDVDGMFFLCRCLDTNHDQVCDGGCVTSPSGVSATNAQPAPEIDPIPMPPCGCGDGIVGPGEQCDDGNDDNHDGCTYDCQLE